MSASMPHVIVAGAGAMGSVIGGLLADGGLRVTLLDVNVAHIETIRNEGLLLIRPDGERRVSVGAATSPTGLEPPDVLIFMCKAPATRALAASLAPLFAHAAPDALAVSFQNGLGNEEAIVAGLGSERVLGGLTARGATKIAPGVVRTYADLPTTVGELAGGLSPRAERLAGLLSAHGLATTASPDILAAKWHKLLLNVALSATSALTDCTIAEMMALPAMEATIRRAMDEAAAVAEACGVSMPAPQRYAILEATAGSASAHNKPSMCADIKAQRPTEREVIYGSVIRRGAQHGVPTPTLQTLAAIMEAIESKYATGRAGGGGGE